MEINYLILTHKNPQQVKRLISRLADKHANFYIHIDSQANVDEFKRILPEPGVHFLDKRFKGTWGDIGIVKATLYGMKVISRSSNNGYCILLSGQDYPLKSKETIFKFLRKKYPTEFMTIYSMPHPGWTKGGMDRLDKYKISKSNQRKHFLQLPSIFDRQFYKTKTLGHLNFLRKKGRYKEMMLIFKKRRFPEFLEPYGGSQWWALTLETLRAILNYIDEHPRYLKYHKYSLLPDEIFFQSIIMRLSDLKSKKFQFEKSFTYVNWERAFGPLPVTFESQDYKELRKASEGYLFARKFDLKKNEEIMDQIDHELLKEE